MSENFEAPLLPFDAPSLPPPRRRKRGAARRTSEASALAFDSIKPCRGKRYLSILRVIAARGTSPAECPTAREILRALKSNGELPPDAERNHVSPRLTDLLEAGFLENPTDPSDSSRFYLKHVAGYAPASVWRMTERGRLLLDHLRGLHKS